MGSPTSVVAQGRILDARTNANLVGARARFYFSTDSKDFHETWTDGTNTWGRLGPDQWAAIHYKGETYIQLA